MLRGTEEYSNAIRSVGELIVAGFWYSDACEATWISLGLPTITLDHQLGVPETSDEWWDLFELDVNAYTDGRKVSIPKYKAIF
tara:strand:- start:215 stop:463 length:249 start_codon:yes stop_codon:yes gene_type:complete